MRCRETSSWTDNKRSVGSILLGAAAAAVSVGAAAWLWPIDPAVVFNRTERLDLLSTLMLYGATVAGLIAVPLRRSPWACLGAGLIPVAVLFTMAAAPRVGSIYIRAPSEWWWISAILGGASAAALRTPYPRIALAWVGLWTGLSGVQAWPDSTPEPEGVAQGPHIWLITLDTVRADHFSFCGGDVDPAQTPHLSALAKESVVYTQAYSTSALTGPAHTTMFSGLLPTETLVRANAHHVQPDLPWMPETLRQAGWHTRAWVSASVLDAKLGYQRGFHTYDSTFERRLIRGHGLVSFIGYKPRAGSDHRRSGWETIAALGPVQDTPTFTWIHLYDAHAPYRPSAETASRHGLSAEQVAATPLSPPFRPRATMQAKTLEREKRKYRAGIEDLDAVVGRLLEHVKPEDVVLVVGDHGESLDEHEYILGHGRLPFAPSMRVPLLIRSPGLKPQRREDVVSTMRLGETILHLAGLESDQGTLLRADPDGGALSMTFGKPLQLGDTQDGGLGKFFGLAWRGPTGSVVWTRDHPAAKYDSLDDPRELTPLELDNSDEDLARLRALTGNVMPAVEPDPDLREALETLGYVE